MRLVTNARDCLYLNWAVPSAAAPRLPQYLSYEVHRWQKEDWIFVTALLFRFVGLHARALPFLRLTYPQMSVRTYVKDLSGGPSVLYLRTWVPPWILPVSRVVGRQPADAGSFSYPSPSDRPEPGEWSWSLENRRSFRVHAKLGAPGGGPGPEVGDWEDTVDYFQRRPTGFAMWKGRVRSVNKTRSTPEVWPLRAEVAVSEVLGEVFPQVDGELWSRVHSAWLCPEIPLQFEVGKPEILRLPTAAPMAAAVSDV